MKPSNPSPHAAARQIDALLEQVAEAYKSLPRSEAALAFRAALARLNLPGGFQRRGFIALPMAESLKSTTENPC
jgi:hypothetical protein